jgi:uncharacterized protein (DUF488 family)
VIYTVGHSTLESDAYAALLRRHGIEQVADVRRFPASRRHPQFNRESLERLLPEQRIAYRHFEGLGGRRRPSPASRNTAWREEGFRGYADYMETPGFAAAFAELLAYARAGPTAMMCAEAAWWRCHRRLLADALLVHGVPVLHIPAQGSAKAHELSEFARVEDRRLWYPGLV